MPRFDPWQLDIDAPDWLEQVCIALLENGAPPTLLANAFLIDVSAIKDLQATLHVKRYGSAELSEAIMFFLWRTIDDAYDILNSAPIATRTRFVTTMLSRAAAMTGKQEPEGFERMRDAFTELTTKIKADAALQPSIYASPEYSPMDAPANDDD